MYLPVNLLNSSTPDLGLEIGLNPASELAFASPPLKVPISLLAPPFFLPPSSPLNPDYYTLSDQTQFPRQVDLPQSCSNVMVSNYCAWAMAVFHSATNGSFPPFLLPSQGLQVESSRLLLLYVYRPAVVLHITHSFSSPFLLQALAGEFNLSLTSTQ